MSILVGTNGNNLLSGTARADLILGGLGNDTLNGLAGNDSLYGGRGADRLFGGADQDSLAGGAGADSVFGGAGADVLSGGDSFLGTTVGDNVRDVLNGDAGSDYVTTDRFDLALGGNGAGDIDSLAIRAFQGANLVYNLDLRQIGTANAAGVVYGYGTARAGQFERADLSISNALAGSVVRMTNGDDSVFLGIFFNPANTAGGTVFGFRGNDRITGSGNDDTIDGGDGDDVISAGGFTGSGGADRVTGGAGSDAFVFSTPDSTSWDVDRITDFQAGVDKIFFVSDGFDAGPSDFAPTLLVRSGNPVSNAAPGLNQVLYDTDDGRLFVDINGRTAGGVVHIATLVGRPNLTTADLHVEYNL